MMDTSAIFPFVFNKDVYHTIEVMIEITVQYKAINISYNYIEIL